MRAAGGAAAVVGGSLFLLWLLSLAKRDASLIDSFWGLGFALLAGVELASASHHAPRQLLLVALVVAWALRLSLYLLWRNHGQPEDPRYARMRDRWGARFWWVSLLTVFLLQGLLMEVVSLPLQVALGVDASRPFGLLDALGVALWTVGLGFEAVGDWQLARFKASPGSAGQVLNHGLWRYTRHPNYFGDFCVWWGLFAIACAAAVPWWTVIGPGTMTWLLTRVSGVPLLEKGLAARRPGYADYVRRTSSFFPRPPRD